jgi:hypothetical protein
MDTFTMRPWLRAAGITDDELRRALRDGELTSLRRGAYVAGPPPTFADERHLLLLRAAGELLVPEAVISHVSAALLHGIDLWRCPLDRVHVTRARAYGGRRGSRVHVHVSPLQEEEIALVDGVAVTSVARTVVDVARMLPFEQAVVVADAALRAGLVDPGQLAEAAARAKGWPGAPKARRAVAFADGRSASVGESRSRVLMVGAGLPTPVLQWRVPGTAFDADFGWPAQGVVGEFDGEIKYGRHLRRGERPGDAVFREKRREDAIRATDRSMVRWTWNDLDHFAPVAGRLRRALRSRTA